MKKQLIITVMVFLSVWAILATITAVDNENRRSRLYDTASELQAECSECERAYEELESNYDKLYEEYKNSYLKGLAYEWLYDARCHFTEEGYDGESALNAIFEREGLSSTERASVRIYIYGISKYEQ